MQIKQLQFDGVEQVSLSDAELDTNLGYGEVLLETLYSMVSAGTELAKLTGLQPTEYPNTPGNRAVGRVLSCGPGVQYCSEGEILFSHTAHATHAKTSRLFAKVPDGVPLDIAPAVGIALVAMTPLRQARPELGDTAVVLGAGTVGNLTAQLFQLSGADVILVDRVEERLETARLCGVENCLNAVDVDVVDTVLGQTNGKGAEVVVDATGNPAVIEMACRMTRRLGDVILVGSPRGEHVQDVTPLLQNVHLWKEHGSLNLKGAHEWRYPLHQNDYVKHSMERNARVLFELIGSEQLKIRPLVSVVPFKEGPEAFASMLADKAALNGVIFDWTC